MKRRGESRQEGTNLLEFSLIFFVLFMILMGIIGFSLIFNAHLNLVLAVNSAARTASTIDYSQKFLYTSYDEEIYEELVGSLVLLSPDHIVDITIYRPEDDGSIGTLRNVLDGDGNLVHENYQNQFRELGTPIGVQVRYNQEVIVPFVSTVTGENIEIIKRSSFRLE